MWRRCRARARDSNMGTNSAENNADVVTKVLRSEKVIS
jgi:hypothetical protein